MIFGAFEVGQSVALGVAVDPKGYVLTLMRVCAVGGNFTQDIGFDDFNIEAIWKCRGLCV